MQFSFDNVKIKKTTAHELVYEQMKNAILNQHWNVGERLPSEPALAEKFGVNRMTVRMAIQKLNALGIVETRIGDGTYVKNFDFNHYFQEVSEFYMHPELLDDVCEFRKMIEVTCAQLAIKRATKEEIKMLETACQEYEEQCKVVEQDYSEETLLVLAEKDLNFHYKICELSHNELCIYSYSVAKETIYQYLIEILKKRIDGWKARNRMQVDDRRHRAIFESIRDKQPEVCKKILLDVVDHKVEL